MSSHGDFAHLKIPLQEIVSATDNFADENFIGQGGFGRVYKGHLVMNGRHIDTAAHRLDPRHGQASKQFWTEISVLSSLTHSYIVSIVGFCDENDEKIIINKYEARGSLDKYLSDPTLTWLQRLQICLNVARALRYIHNDVGGDVSIIHGNIKSSIILLSEDWEPKLSGFGFSITNTTTDQRNLLLLDDTTGFVNHKSDVYSFGVVLFEVLCGRAAIIQVNKKISNLATLAKLHYEEGTLDEIIHPDLREQIDPQSLSIFSKTAYACLNQQQSQPPDAEQVVKSLEEALMEFQAKVKYTKHLNIPLRDIRLATNNFSEENLIGKGAYSTVYKCKLPNTENDVVIKRIINTGEQGFREELEMLSKCKHPNIISLLGLCHEDGHMILVLEYASNGSLDDHLGYTDRLDSFTWDQRIQICLDVAHGLKHLHTGMDDKNVIIHRDIKSGNILLDQNGRAKIADFGLSTSQHSYKMGRNTLNNISNRPVSFQRPINPPSRGYIAPPSIGDLRLTYDIGPPSYSNINFARGASGDTYVARGYNNRTKNSNDFGPPSANTYRRIGNSNIYTTHIIAGTEVYLDPEYRETGELKKESDIYSFGVVLFEVLCGKLAYDVDYTADSKTGLASIARRRFKEGNLLEMMIDPKLKKIVDGNFSVRNKAFYKVSLETFARIAHQCVAETQAKRPRIEVVIKELEMALHLLTSGKFAELQVPLEEILLATNRFDKKNSIGEGTSEEFYKGSLMRLEKPINVLARRFNGEELEFWTEISMLSSLEHKNHKNLLSFVGFCLEKSEKIIIYDNVVRGSLDQLLLSDPDFTCYQRLKVCLGVAKALKDIHYDVIHCDINSSKIFVDKDWEAKVFGFELSTEYPESWMHRLLFSHHFDTSSGYQDPVYVKTKSAIPRYDVYSFGVILFEVLYGRKAIMTKDGGLIPSLAKNAAMVHYKEGKLEEMMIHSDLRKQMDSQSLKIFLETACQCLEERVKRPTMDKVFTKLVEATELQWVHDIQVPSKPVDEATSSNNLKKKMVIPLEKISAATNSFKPQIAVAYGGFGLVFKADLDASDIPSLSSMEGKITVAVKQIFSRADDKGEKGYLAEIELLTTCKHENIVSLLGYCRQDKQMILVYEYAFNGSLGDYFCKNPKQSTSLTWVQRIKICLDIARGLKYLHTDMDGKPRIIHRDIKSDNILLDEELNAKIADFGLSKAQPKNQETWQSHYPVGTSVYKDPEFVTTNKYKKESDTYSFGVVLFEILSGTLAYDPVYVDENKNGLAAIARQRFIDGTLKELIDPKIIEEDEDHIFTLNRGPNQDSFDTFSDIALKCLAETQASRPTIDVVIDELQRALEFQGEPLVLTRFQHKDIESAIKTSAKTISFGSDASGGIVYKAKLHFVSKSSLPVEKKNNVELEKEPINVAIKHISSIEDGQGDQQGFFEEIDVLTRCKHGNIVSLLGFCGEGREMYLVFEDASNGSIDDYLRKTDNKANLTWGERLQWCLDIARGLDHLHTKMGSTQGIIHGDIKSANILIGKNLEAKIAYYGLSKSHQANQVASGTNNRVGTDVYLDPEYEKTRTLSKKSDVFSFGVVLLELFCGRLAYDPKYKIENDKGLSPIARQGFIDMTIKKMIDPALKVENDDDIFTSNRGPNQDSLNKFLHIAIRCLEETPAKRPTMGVAIRELDIALHFQENLTTRLQISFEDIKSWTNDFSNKVGSGEYWKAYKGDINLPLAQSNAKFVTNVSVFAKRWDSTFAQGRQQFLNELKVLFRYKHKNIIGVYGYCDKDDEKIIVYEHASKGSLDKSLNNNVDLNWIQRLKICIDVASGLEFLHGGAIMLENVVHNNIRSSNILLTGDWKAKIANLELSTVHAYDQDMEHVINDADKPGYLAPEYKHGSLPSESDIYSFGVVLFEILCGSLAWQEGSESLATLVMNRHKEGKLDEMVLEGIREQPTTESLKAFQSIALQSLHGEKDKRPKASEVVKQLKNALEFQEDHDIWKPKLPSNYQEIIDMSKDPHQMNSMNKKKDLHKKFTEGIFLEEEKVVISNMNKDFNKKKDLNKKKKLVVEGEEPLHEGKVWFSLPRNAKEGKTLISATTFSYGNHRSHKWKSIQKSTARFDSVAKMTDISDLKIQIKLKTSFLALDVAYGVYLVFKFCDRRQFSGKLMYVNLKYKKGSETLHAYFATPRDDGWMTIELFRFLKQKKDTDFEVFLESFSRRYCGGGAIYVQAIEFQAIDNMKDTEIEKLKGIQQVPELMVNQMQQSTNDLEETSKISVNREELPCEVNGKKLLIVSASKVLFNPDEEIEHFESKPSAESRFQYVMELLPRHVFRIKYKIDSKMLSPFTEYTCYLVFKLSEKCCGLNCPVIVRDLLQRKFKHAKILYFRSPASWNQHDAKWVPEERKDGWMEVMVWRFNSRQKLRSTDHIPMYLKLICYEGSMSGLIVCGLEFRPTT